MVRYYSLFAALFVFSSTLLADTDWEYDRIHGGLTAYAAPDGSQVALVRDGFGRYPLQVMDAASGVTWHFQDAPGQQRAILTHSQGGVETTTHYRVIAPDIYVLFDDNGQVDYNLGNVRFGIDSSGSSTTWLSLSDYQESVRALLDTNQQVHTWFGYDALGKPTQQDGPACVTACPRGRAFDRRFQGHRYLAWDNTASGYQPGFTDNRDRLYSHDQGLRFMHVDALGSSISPYTAYGDDPVNNTDPSGLMEMESKEESVEPRSDFIRPLRNVEVDNEPYFKPLRKLEDWNRAHFSKFERASKNESKNVVPFKQRVELLDLLNKLIETTAGSEEGLITRFAKDRILYSESFTRHEFERINAHAFNTIYGSREKAQSRSKNKTGNLLPGEPFIVHIEPINKGLAIWDPNRHLRPTKTQNEYYVGDWRQMLVPQNANNKVQSHLVAGGSPQAQWKYFSEHLSGSVARKKYFKKLTPNEQLELFETLNVMRSKNKISIDQTLFKEFEQAVYGGLL